MENCIFQPNGHKFRCERCGLVVTKPGPANCRATIQNPPPNPEPQPANLEVPPLLTRLANFGAAALSHALKGNPTVSEEVLQERLAICRGCELFKPDDASRKTGVCTHNSCGCNIKDQSEYLNKLAWADQECPLKKWLKERGK